MSRRLMCGAVAVLCAASSVASLSAQSMTAPAAVRVAGRNVPSAPRADGAGSWSVEQCMAGVTYGAPLKLAVSYGGGFLYESNEGADYCALAVAKLGLGGVQASTGIGTSFAPWGTGVMVTGNLVRTFGAPLDATPNRTYVGASVHLWPVLALGGEIGMLWRLGDKNGESTSGHRVITWSAGFGF